MQACGHLLETPVLEAPRPPPLSPRHHANELEKHANENAYVASSVNVREAAALAASYEEHHAQAAMGTLMSFKDAEYMRQMQQDTTALARREAQRLAGPNMFCLASFCATRCTIQERAWSYENVPGLFTVGFDICVLMHRICPL